MDASDQGPSGAGPAVDIRHLTRRFGRVVAVADASLEIEKAAIFGLIGRNGAGKSTLIKMLTTLLPPTSGTARVAGYDIVRQSVEVRRRIGYVPQLHSADGLLTGYENMLLSARLYAIPRREQRPRIGQALARMGLAEAAGRLAGDYSGGMVRRLEIAQTLLHRPSVLFLDEPTAGLDPDVRRTVWDHLLGLRDSFGTTMIVTSHRLEELDRFCDRIAFIGQGRIVAVGTPLELKARAGPDATLDDVFIQLVGLNSETEPEQGHGDLRGSPRAGRRHR